MNGLKHGKGTFENDQFKYTGFFKEDVISGIGYYKEDKNSEEYLGHWDNGKYNGFGYLFEKD